MTIYPCCRHCADNDDCDGTPHAEPCNGDQSDRAYGYCSGGVPL